MNKKSPSAPSIPEIRVPTAAELQEQAINANIASLPKLLDAYKQFGPEYSKALTDIFIQQQQRLPEAFPEQYQVLQPLTKAVSGRLDSIGGSLDDIPLPLLETNREAIRGAQSIRGMAESPISAASEALQLGTLAEDYRRNVITEGFNFMNMNFPSMETTMTPAAIGLEPASIDSLIETGSNQAGQQAQATLGRFALEQQRFNKEMERKIARARNVGTMFGPVIGATYGYSTMGGDGAAAGGAAGMETAFKVAGAAGGGGSGTFF